jgi:hypothetical protein
VHETHTGGREFAFRFLAHVKYDERRKVFHAERHRSAGHHHVNRIGALARLENHGVADEPEVSRKLLEPSPTLSDVTTR